MGVRGSGGGGGAGRVVVRVYADGLGSGWRDPKKQKKFFHHCSAMEGILCFLTNLTFCVDM